MKNFDSIGEILDFAIAREEEAISLYSDLAEKAAKPAARALFKGFADEERGHREKLRALQGGKVELSPGSQVTDLKIGDYLADVEPSPDMGYQQVLIMAMKKEKAAFRLYTDLAERAEGDLKQFFLGLAEEEAKHKLRFEVEYDGRVLADN